MILVVASTFPRWVADVEPNFIFELSKRLVDEFDVHVVCPAAQGALAQESMAGIQVHRFCYAPARLQTLVNNGGIAANLKAAPWKWLLVPFFLLSLQLKVVYLILKLKPSIIHAHWIIPQGFAIALLGLFIPLPITIITSHGADLFGFKGNLLTKLKRYTLAKADHVTVVSNVMKTPVAALGLPLERLSVMPMGVDGSGRFTPNDAVNRESALVLFVGRLVSKKGVNYLIDAIARVRLQVPDVKLLVIGSGPEHSGLVEKVEALQLQHCVAFKPALPQELLVDYYRKAALFVAPFVEAKDGDQEGLGLVTLEALACHCPVLIGNVAAVQDLFAEDSAWVVNPKDLDAFAEKIVFSLRNPEISQAWVSEGNAVLNDRFSWETCSARYRRLFQHLLALPPH